MLEELYQKHYRELYRYCLAACRNPGTAEDLVQEAFVRALTHADTFSLLGPQQQRAWLYKTVRNLLYDRYRRYKQLETLLAAAEEETAATDDGYTAVEIALLLSQLPDRERSLVQMRYLEGYNATELGKLFGEPPSTIRARLRRARQLLKQMLNP